MSTQSNDFPTKTEMMQTIESGTWARENGVYHSILPYGYRKHNPIETLCGIQTAFENMGEYAQSYWLRDLPKHGGPTLRPNQQERLLHFAGSWAWTGWDTTSSQRYCNPKYTHDEYPVIEDEERRLWLINKTSDLPMWGPKKWGVCFGVSARHARRIRDKLYGEHHPDKHFPTLARTVETLNKWGYSYTTLAKALDYTPQGLRKMRNNHASDFRPPSNPYDGSLIDQNL